MKSRRNMCDPWVIYLGASPIVMTNKKVSQLWLEKVMVGSGFILFKEKSLGSEAVVAVGKRNEVMIAEERNAKYWLCSCTRHSVGSYNSSH